MSSLNGTSVGPDVGLVHDYLLVMRGAERTFSHIAASWPDARIHTLLYDERGTEGRFAHREIHTSWLQRLGVRQRSFRRLLPLFPRATEALRTHRHRLVVSSSSAFAHGVPLAEDAVHVCYCHTPFRYAWHDFARTLHHARPAIRPALRRTLGRIREWDRSVAARGTHYVANSELTRRRIEEFWGREAIVIHPPVEVDRFSIGTADGYFLVVAELVGHKSVEVALDAAARVAQPIRVVGDGPDLKRLSRIYGSTAEFLGRVRDERLVELYAGARALVVPNVEEFGIAAVEAQASGRPVVAASVGGTSETVRDGETGVLVTPGDVGDLAEAMTQVDFDRFDPERIRRHAMQFSPERFRERFGREVARVAGLEPAPTAA